MIIRIPGTGGDLEPVIINRFPQHCPHCHHTISPDFKHANLINPQLELVFRCPNTLCNHYFISLYLKHTTMAKEIIYNYYGPSTGTVMKKTFSKIIEEISPHFPALFSQACQTEYYNFKELSYAGYRLSLDRLLKDFLQLQFPDRAAYILNLSVSQAIHEFIEAPNIRKIAGRTAWLKNDELKQVMELNEKDLMNLKLLVDMVVHHIELEKLPDKYEQDFEQQSILN